VLDGTGATGTLTTTSGTVINNAGLVSATSFPNSNITGNGGSTTSTSQVDVPGSTMNPFATTAATTNVLFLVDANGYNANYPVDGSTMQVYVIDSVNGNIINFPVVGNSRLTAIAQNSSEVITGWSTNSSSQLVSFPVVIPLSAGSHTLKLQYKVNGTGTASLPFFYLAYIVLGPA